MTLSPASKNRIALLAVCLGALMFGLEITSVPVILPNLERTLGGNFQEMQWVMNAYTLACTTVLMATGTLADRFGRKRTFLISVIAFGATSALCGFAQSIEVLIAGRFLQGLAGGAMLICSIALLSHAFQDAAGRSRAFATWGIVSGIGLGFGPLVGSAIIALTGWKWIFLVHLPLAALTLAMAASAVSESRDPDATHLDAMGIITLSLAVFGLVYFITQGVALGTPGAVAVGIATVASFAAFLFAERRQAHAMFDFSVFRNRQFSGAILGCIAMNVSYWPFMIYLPIYFQVGLGYDPLSTGLCLLAYTLPALIFPPVGERMSLRYGAGAVIPFGLFTIGLGFVAMKIGSAAAHPGWLTMLPGLLLSGVGIGITNTPVTNTTTASVPASRAGMASGIDMSARLITLAVNIALMGLLLVERIASTLRGSAGSSVDIARLRSAAENLASGHSGSGAGLEGLGKLPDFLVRHSLAEGFGLVMVYGGIGAWILAGLSFVLFRPVPQETGRRFAAQRPGSRGRRAGMPNKEQVIGLYQAYATGDAARIGAFLHEDAVWVAPPGNATQVALGYGTGDQAGPPDGSNNLIGRETIAGFMARDFGRLFVNPGNEVRGLYGDGDHVVIEHRLSATFPNGRSYVNDYCFVFDFRDGLVCRIREYMDTRGGWVQAFGDGPGQPLVPAWRSSFSSGTA